MKIVGWNVNGLRAVHRKGNWSWFEETQPDILCLQETKASPDQLAPEVSNPEGYFSYFSSSQTRKGYSGVAVYSKVEPKEWNEGIGIKKYDEQGRILTLVFEEFVLINVYVPNGNSKTAPLDFKLEFYEELLKYMDGFRAKGHKVIMTGDINVAHEEIDLARPKENSKRIGFLPEERAWIDEYLAAGYVDAFRNFYPEKIDVYSYWDVQSRARDRNVGWRIDYFFVSQDLLSKTKTSEVLSDVYGSDHCPIYLELNF